MGFKGQHTRSKKYENFRNYAVPILRRQATRHLWTYRKFYHEFWTKFCSAYDYDLKKLENDDNYRLKILDRLRDIKRRHAWVLDDKVTIEAGSHHIRREKTIRKRRKKWCEEKKENITEVTQVVLVTDEKIVKHEVLEVNFVSDITRSTYDQMNLMSRFQTDFLEDYLYFLGGGQEDFKLMPDGSKRKRHASNLLHLKLTAKFQNQINQMSEVLLESDVEDDDYFSKIKEVNSKIQLVSEIVKSSKDLDLQFMSVIKDTVDNQMQIQKVLQANIINDNSLQQHAKIQPNLPSAAQQLVNVKDQDKIVQDLTMLSSSVSEKLLDELILHNNCYEEKNVSNQQAVGSNDYDENQSKVIEHEN